MPKPSQTKASKASLPHTHPARPLHWTAQCISFQALVTDEHKCLSAVLNSGTILTEVQWWEADSCSFPASLLGHFDPTTIVQAIGFLEAILPELTA